MTIGEAWRPQKMAICRDLSGPTLRLSTKHRLGSIRKKRKSNPLDPLDEGENSLGILSRRNSLPIVAVTTQHSLLCAMFPTFPKKMMDCMVLRYYGNYYKIRKVLINKGWKPETNHLFENRRDPHITTKYYFGAIPSAKRQQQLFKDQPSGSFITYFRYVDGNPLYYVLIIDQGKFIETRISGPDALPSELPWLNNPISDYHYKRTVADIPHVGASNLLDSYESLFGSM